jgi:hypothetical protein
MNENWELGKELVLYRVFREEFWCCIEYNLYEMTKMNERDLVIHHILFSFNLEDKIINLCDFLLPFPPQLGSRQQLQQHQRKKEVETYLTSPPAFFSSSRINFCLSKHSSLKVSPHLNRL